MFYIYPNLINCIVCIVLNFILLYIFQYVHIIK